MAKSNKNNDKKQGRVKSTVKVVAKKLMAPIANVNSNHTPSSKQDETSMKHDKRNVKFSGRNNDLGAGKNLRSSSMTFDEENTNDTETAQFMEDGEEIEMEINYGGAAAKEFASKTKETDYESESENENESFLQEVEMGEITSDVEETDKSEYAEEEQMYDCQSKATVSSSSKKKDKEKRNSVEERLNLLSDALLEMKDMFCQQIGRKNEGNK